ncbi:MAG: prepilin-type N-terminal cleavage/methylation domain-containing protein [Planctomycetota bacterium]
MLKSLWSRAGFTLVELLIVVVILSILAAVAIPQFANSAEEARAANLQANLSVLRNALEYYKLQHRGAYPGYPVGGGAPTETLVGNQLLLASQADGSTAAIGTSGYDYGPYISEAVPENPVNGLSTVQVVADGATFPAADDSTGWIYQPEIGRVRANSTLSAPSGKAYYNF